MCTRKRNMTGVLLTCAVICIASVLVMTVAVIFPRESREFKPPDFEQSAESGTPEVPDGLGYSSLEIPGEFTVFVCGKVIIKDGAADVYFTNNRANDVWLKLRVLDSENNILGETGLINPGEYVKSVNFTESPPTGTEIQLKIMAYEPDTYHSAGFVILNTMIGGE